MRLLRLPSPGCDRRAPAEHDAVVELGGQARRALDHGDLDRAADRARAIATVLRPHTVVEEEALFPAMAEEFPGHVDVLVADHRRIEEVLAESAAGTPSDAAWPDRLAKTLSDLREHILREQDGVFPAALVSLDSDQWDALAAARARVPSGAPGTPPASQDPTEGHT